MIEAIKELNPAYNPQVHKEPVHLYGYRGDRRAEKANIVIPKAQVGIASNDIGFLKKGQGKYEMIISAYDEGATWTTGVVNKLKQLYAKNVIIKQSKKMKHKVRSQEVQKDGSIKIKVRVRN